jgi:aryl-alcohol dehydrogenase-like predicted oxidoreductase
LGASKVAQLEENLKATAAAEQLTPDILEELDEILGSKPKDPSNSDNH